MKNKYGHKEYTGRDSAGFATYEIAQRDTGKPVAESLPTIAKTEALPVRIAR